MSKTSTNKFLNPQTGRISITQAFGKDLAILLADKISTVYKAFAKKDFCDSIKNEVEGKSYTQRIEVIADNLKNYLPEDYLKALAILLQILGPENLEETGMFTHFYWLMPIGKFIEKYGLDHFDESIEAIEELTKRNTGEYAIRSFARKYPKQTITVCTKWASSPNFHLRRLASEGLRPKLPWATKLDIWNENPKPIFDILDILKEDNIKFVKKSVANHIRDWIKVNPKAAKQLIDHWRKSNNEHTQWIIKHANR